MTQTNYTPTSGQVGALATSDRFTSVSRVYAGRPQISTLTFGGTATDGVYSIDFQNLDVDNITVPITRTGGSPATNTDLAAAWIVVAENDTDLRRAFLFSQAAGVVTITARENGNPFTLANPVVTGPATLVAATTQTSTPANLPMGIAVVLSGNGDKQIVQPDAGSTAFEIQGITWNGNSNTDNTVIPTLGTSEQFVAEFAAGSMVPVLKTGVIYVLPEVNVSAGDPVFARMTATGTEVFGALSNVTDGGDNLQIQAVWEWDGLANQPTAVRLNLPGGA